MENPRPRSAFTLIELLTVIAVIAILAAILIPSIGGVREKARTAQGASNLRQIAAALNLFQNEHSKYPGAHYKYPEGHPNEGERINWKQAIAEHLGLRDDDWDAPIFSCPNVEEQWTEDWEGNNPPSYSTNPALIISSSEEGERPLNVKRPSEVVLVMDASTMNNGASDGNLYGISGSFNGFATRAPEQAITIGNYATSPRATPRFRQGGSPGTPGAANVAFVDGHVELIEYGDLKYKHFAIHY
jgi:prepilin-type N-terminal cleavage/methylation domain-containing protein/prepilin-type processing-associated H-X9-DG protein